MQEKKTVFAKKQQMTGYGDKATRHLTFLANAYIIIYAR